MLERPEVRLVKNRYSAPGAKAVANGAASEQRTADVLAKMHPDFVRQPNFQGMSHPWRKQHYTPDFGLKAFCLDHWVTPRTAQSREGPVCVQLLIEQKSATNPRSGFVEAWSKHIENLSILRQQWGLVTVFVYDLPGFSEDLDGRLHEQGAATDVICLNVDELADGMLMPATLKLLDRIGPFNANPGMDIKAASAYSSEFLYAEWFTRTQ